jgi:protein gp37
MADRSTIEWTEATWNPVTGCSKVSPGCKNCYAEKLALRLQAMGQANYANGFDVTTHASALDLPLSWRRPRTVFVNSMSDLFHELVPVEFIEEVFAIMRRAEQHRFQVLTKRSVRLLELAPRLRWARNIWMGVSVENQTCVHRIDHLRETEAAVKFISFEPLLGPIPDLDLTGVDWAIVGGESGPGARAMQKEWATEIRDRCVEESVPFFFKQWGGTRKKETGRELDGKCWSEMPGEGQQAALL